MKKKILFIMPSMNIGGAERSLLGLLDHLDYSEYEVSLFLYRNEGEFLPYISDNVVKIPSMREYATFDVPIVELLLSRQFLFGIARIISKIALKLHTVFSHEKEGVWMHMQYTSHYLQRMLPKIPGKYDLAIMYLGVAETLVNKVEAEKKIAWNHTDYDTLFPNRTMDIRLYRQIDAIVSVSESCTEKVKAFYPELADKALTIENCLSKELIYRLSEEKVSDFPKDENNRLLSVGRFSYAKNFDNVPTICKLLLEHGLKIKWYLIGYGGDEDLIRSKIAEQNMEDHVIILGKKQNPYPYMRHCDIYIQPSRFEGKCVAVREAQILGKPVIITRYETSTSQLEEDVDGAIVPMDNVACAEEISRLLKRPDILARLGDACSVRDYSNKNETEKLLQLFEI